MMLGGKGAAFSGSSLGYVGGASDTAASGGFSVDISSLSHATGDVGILYVVGVSPLESTPGITGWTLLSAADEGPCGTEVYYRAMLSSDTTVASTTAHYNNVSASVNIFTGVSTSAPSFAYLSGPTSLPNCPQGAAVTGSKAFSLALGALGYGTWSSITAPSGYDMCIGVASVAAEIYNYPAYKVITTQDTPGLFGGSTSSSPYIGYTLTLQEA